MVGVRANWEKGPREKNRQDHNSSISNDLTSTSLPRINAAVALLGSYKNTLQYQRNTNYEGLKVLLDGYCIHI